MSKYPSIIKAEQLVEEIGKDDLVILDCRFRLSDKDWGLEQYLKGHIAGAYYLDLDKDLSSSLKAHGGRHPLPTNLEETLGNLGIVLNQTRVVVYDDSRFAFAARLWWLLRYLGHNSVQILDGGWNAWQNQNYPIESNIPPRRIPTIFAAQPHRDWLIEYRQIQENLTSKEAILIDSREERRYQGKEEPIDPVAGHIPSAINSPYLWITDEQGYIKEDQQSIWNDYQNTDKPLWIYCGSGVTACVNLFSLEQVGLFERAKLYLGGWSDWCSYLEEWKSTE